MILGGASFYRFIYPVASGGGVPLFSSSSIVDWSARKGVVD